MLEILNIEDVYFLKTDLEFSINTFIEMIKKNNGMKKRSFAEDYTVKILKNLIFGAVDLRENYTKYYFEEYDSFEEYLYSKELFEMETIQSIKIRSNESLWMLRFIRNDYSIKTILGFEDENLHTINKTLEYILNEN